MRLQELPAAERASFFRSARISAEKTITTDAQAQTQATLQLQQIAEWICDQSMNQGQQRDHDGASMTVEEMMQACRQVFAHWAAASASLPMNVWIEWIRVGCALYTSQQQHSDCGDILLSIKSSPPPLGLPQAHAHCNRELQREFSTTLWDTVFCAVTSASMNNGAIYAALLDVYTHWMVHAMRNYEAVFILNVGWNLSSHIQAAMKSSLSNSFTFTPVVVSALETSISRDNAEDVSAAACISLIVISAFNSKEVDTTISSIRDMVVGLILKKTIFPPALRGNSLIALTFGLVEIIRLDRDGNRPNLRSLAAWNRTLAIVYTVLRCANLPLLSFRLADTVEEELARMKPMMELALATTVREYRNHCDGIHVLLQMVDMMKEEAITTLRSTHSSYLSLIRALQTVLPEEYFRDAFKNYVDNEIQSVLTQYIEQPAHMLKYLKNLYRSVSLTLQSVIHADHDSPDPIEITRAFRVMASLEFARESCSSRSTNEFMNALTQKLEACAERTPDVVLPAILGPQNLGEAPVIKPEFDLIASCDGLARAVTMQRKLRLVLGQPPSILDDALALVFSGIYNGYEPWDSFSHRFLGYCFTHLSAYISVYKVFPYYLRVTLAQYPANTSREVLAKVCGVVFGSLYFMASNSEGTSAYVGPTQMIPWALKQVCARTKYMILTDKDETTSDTQFEEHKQSGLYLAGLLFELVKMAPLTLLPRCAMELEEMFNDCAMRNRSMLIELQQTLFGSVSQNCDADKRAWLTSWYLELSRAYLYTNPKDDESNDDGLDQDRVHARL